MLSGNALEKEYLQKVLENSWDEMTPSQQDQYLKSINALIHTQNIKEVTDFSGLLSLMALNKLIGYFLTRIIFMGGPVVFSSTAGLAGFSLLGGAGVLGASLVGGAASVGTMMSRTSLEGAKYFAPYVLGRTASMLNPIGWALNAYAAYQIAGTAFRVTIPACVIIALLRKKYEISPKEAAQCQKYDRLVHALLDKVSSLEELENKLLGCYAFGKTIIANAYSADTDSYLNLALFGIIDNTMSQLIKEKYKSLPVKTSLAETAQYALQNLSCTLDELTAVKDYLLEICGEYNVKMQVENEFSKITA